MFLKAFATVGVGAGILVLTAVPALAGTDSDSASVAGVAVSVTDVEWAGEYCMNVPVTLSVRTATLSTSWSGSLWSKGDSVYFSGTGSTTTTRDLEICKYGGRGPGTYYLSGTITARSANSYRSESLYLSAPFAIAKARTTAIITSVHRSYGRVAVKGRVATQDGLAPGGYVRVQAKKPGRNQFWRTISTQPLWYLTKVSSFNHRLPKRTKYRLVYGGDTLAYPATSPVRVR